MKEFDFDELDKAVNSLMADAKTKGEANSEPQVAPEDKPVLEITPSKEKPEVLLEAVNDVPKVESVDEPSVEPLDEEVVPSREENSRQPAENVENAKPIAPPRRSGRFMDVVHPSSDMRPSLRSHSEAIVSPISTEVVAEEIVKAPAVESEVMSDVETQDEPPAYDPIAFEENKKSDDQDEPEKADAASIASPEEPDVLQADLDASLTESESSETDTESVSGPSPFLTDAKVEKRPLNSEAITPPELDEEVAVEVQEKDSEVPIEPQPAELGSDILAIESGAVEVEAPEEAAPAYKGVTTTTVPATVAPVSITQQYREQPSSTPEDHQAIYDTAAHPALAHPAKKHSGWWIVLWIVLLLALGAGGAAALYMLKVI